MEPLNESPATGFLPHLKEFATANPWVAIIAAVIVLLIVGQFVWKILKAVRFNMEDSQRSAKIRKVLSKCKLGKANIIFGTTSTVVEITNDSNETFTISRVSLIKNKIEFPLKLAYAGQVSPPRTLPEVCEVQRTAIILEPQATFAFTHPINALFILNDKETFHVVMDAKYLVQGTTKTVTEESSKKKPSSIESWV